MTSEQSHDGTDHADLYATAGEVCLEIPSDRIVLTPEMAEEWSDKLKQAAENARNRQHNTAAEYIEDSDKPLMDGDGI